MGVKIEVDQLARLMQHAALNPDEWERALNAVNSFVGGNGAVLLSVQARQRIAPASTDMVEMIDDYFTRGWCFNDAREPCIPLLRKHGIVFDRQFQSVDDLNRSEYYNDFLARHRRKWFVGIGASVAGDDWCLALQRAHNVDPFTPEDLPRLEFVRDLLRNAAGLSTTIGRSCLAGIRHALYVMPKPAILFDWRARVLDANDEAISIVGKYINKNGNICFTSAKETERFESMISDAFHIEKFGTNQSHYDFHIGKKHYYFQANSLLRQENLIATSAAALVVVHQKPSNLSAILKRKCSLTETEIKVAMAISKGDRVREIADAHHVQTNTVRTQLKSIYQKTDVFSQSQLVAFIRDLSLDP